MRRLLVFFMAYVGCFGITYAATPDQCKDILTNGVMAKTNYKYNDFLKQILHSRFSKLEYEESTKDTSFGGTIPVYDVMVGAEGKQKARNEYRQAIERTLKMSLVQKHELEIAISSGDPAIIQAWEECMRRDEGGLYIWFVPQTATTAILHVRWLAGKVIDPKPMTITNVQTTPPQQWNRRNSPCLYEGRIYKDKDECNSQVTLASSTQDLIVTANGKAQIPVAANAYLAPRLTWVNRTIVLDSTLEKDPARRYATVSSQAQNGKATSAPTCIDPQRIGKGIPITSSFKSSATAYNCWGQGWCSSPSVSPETGKACWTVTVNPDQSHASCACTASASFDILLSGWYPIDSPEVKAAPGAPQTPQQVSARYSIMQSAPPPRK